MEFCYELSIGVILKYVEDKQVKSLCLIINQTMKTATTLLTLGLDGGE
jgi:hypothetical protein